MARLAVAVLAASLSSLSFPFHVEASSGSDLSPRRRLMFPPQFLRAPFERLERKDKGADGKEAAHDEDGTSAEPFDPLAESPGADGDEDGAAAGEEDEEGEEEEEVAGGPGDEMADESPSGEDDTVDVPGAETSAAAAASNATIPAVPAGASVIFVRPSPHQRDTPIMFGAAPPAMGPHQPGQGPPTPASELTGAAVALSASVLSLFTRLLVLSLLYGVNPFSSGESRAFTPNPAQHFAFERLNERYAKDGLALRKALEFAPPQGTLARYRANGGGGAPLLGPVRRWRRGAGRRVKERRKAAGAAGTNSGPVDVDEGGGRRAANGPLPYDRTVIVLDFCPAHHVASSDPPSLYSAPPDPIEALRDQVSFLLSQYRDPTVRPLLGSDVEVCVRLESPGGGVHDFGLAADQLARLRRESAETSEPEADENADADADGGVDSTDGEQAETAAAGPSALGGISLTVCVDRIAASGGYMMACQATPGRLLAAPFAAVGSVGVIREGINVHDTLKKVGVRPLVLRAGENKVPLDMISEVKDEDVDKVQRDMDRVHGAFQKLVADARPEIVERIASTATAADGDVGLVDGTSEWAQSASSGALTGEVYLGGEALRRGLVDRLITSDEYIAERVERGDRVLRLYRLDRSKFGLHLNPLDLLLFGSPNGSPLGRLRGAASRWTARCRGGLAEVRARYPQATAAAKVGGAVGLAGLLRGAEGAIAGAVAATRGDVDGGGL